MPFCMQVLGADLAILDEIDSGLDVDALRDVADAVNRLLTPKNSLLMITHYERLLNFIKPVCVHVMVSHLKILKNYMILFQVWGWLGGNGVLGGLDASPYLVGEGKIYIFYKILHGHFI